MTSVVLVQNWEVAHEISINMSPKKGEKDFFRINVSANIIDLWEGKIKYKLHKEVLKVKITTAAQNFIKSTKFLYNTEAQIIGIPNTKLIKRNKVLTELP